MTAHPDEADRLRRRIARERRARAEAEKLLNDKARELFVANERLREIAAGLEKQVDFKALELLNAQRLARFGTLFWDIRADQIIWSEGVYHVLGLDPETEQLSFERYLSLIHPEDRDEIAAYIGQSLDDMLELHREYRIEHRVVTPAGEVRWVRGYAEAVSYKDAEIEYVIGAVRDVTSDKRAERVADESRRIIEQRVHELERTRDELAEARDAAQSANRTKSRFLAMMSHEIRTPMNGILGTLNMLGESSLDGQQQKLVRMALASGENLRNILNDILDLSKMEAGRLELESESFVLRTLVEDACAFWRPLVEQKSLEFRIEIDAQLPSFVRGDPARIRQILNNLLSNALKFTSRGAVLVRVAATGVGGDADGERIEVTFDVQDSGVGIARDQQRLLFREFSQLGEPGAQGLSGTGLGLAISRQLAELMDGTMGVTSAPGVGSSFWLRLPLDVAEAPLREADSGPLRALSETLGRRPRVLLAEDVPTNQIIAEHMLVGFDCFVEVAANGIEVLDALSERPFDVVLMDVSMPEMDGLEATRRIRSRDDALRRIPILGVTAYAMKEDIERFLAAGMDRCIAKPLARGELHAALEALLVADTPAAPSEEVPASGVLVDAAVLDDLLAYLSKAQVQALLERVDADLVAVIERATRAFEGDDGIELGRAAHAAKGLAGGIGASALAACAARIEAAARAGAGGDSLTSDMEALRDLVARTLEYFAGLRAPDGAGDSAG